MSNYLAIATVSAALADRLNTVVNAVDGQAGAVVGPPVAPGESPTDPQVRVFLYNVQPNGSWRNEDVPTRTSGGRVIARPQAAFDLHYLLTFQGGQSDLEPQRMLGVAVNELHANPILSREEIRSVIADTQLEPLIGLSDLDEQPEMVRFSPLLLDLEALSKLWSVLFQIPYRLSVACQASVVLISPDTPPRSTLPVSERQLLVTTIRRPRIERIDTADDPGDPILIGTTLRIRGSQLRGDITRVWFGTVDTHPDSADVTDREIRVDVPADARAGLVGVRVEHRFLVGEPAVERPAGQSNVMPVMLRPRLTAVGVTVTESTADMRAGTLDLTVESAVGKRQRVIAHLSQIGQPAGTPAEIYSFADESRDLPGEPEETNDLSIPLVDVRTGTYLVRVSVDGAESPLERDNVSGNYIAPQVDIS